MIENLALHGVRADDLVPSLMTTHTVANPEYDPVEAKKQAEQKKEDDERTLFEEQDDISEVTVSLGSTSPSLPKSFSSPSMSSHDSKTFQTTTRVLEDTSTAQLAGVTTSLSSVDERVTLDIRWTVLCDLFLILIADSVYDARSRVLLEYVAIHLGLGWLDVVKFEQRVTEALEIQEGTERIEQREVVEGRQKSSRKRRYMMVGLATLGASAFSYSEYRRLQSTLLTHILASRWWPCNWVICRIARPRHWRRYRCCSHDSWNLWHGRFPGWHSWCGCNHYWWRSHWFWYCCARYVSKDAVCANFRHLATT